MDVWPKITIITPSFNQGEYIEECIVSVLSQNYPNLQFIVIDGGSQDKTVEILKKYESKIDHWISESDNGQTDAINKGLKVSTGEIVNWLNSDDKLAQGSLFEIARLFLENNGANLVVGRTNFFQDNVLVGSSGKVIFEDRESTFAYGQVNQPAMFYKLDILKLIGLDSSLHFCMDVDLWLRYLLRFGLDTIVTTEKVIADFRFHTESKTISKPEKFVTEKEEIYNRILKGYQNGRLVNNSLTYILPMNTSLRMELVKNYTFLWKSDKSSLLNQKRNALTTLSKVNPLKLRKNELRRYFGVIKNIIFK
jgi:glycosyltransferase involved in cell wall biosynthesis